MMIVIGPIAATIIGLLIYMLSNHPKVMEAGRLLYFAGLLWTLYSVLGKGVHVS